MAQLSASMAILVFALPVPFIGAGTARHGAQPTMYYVSMSGNDASGVPNDRARPYRSPRGAYAAIPMDITSGSGAHVIEFLDGATYGQLEMGLRVTDSTHRVVLRASPGMRPTLDALTTADGSLGVRNGKATLVIRADYVTVQGLRFTNTGHDSTFGPSDGSGSELMVRLEGSHAAIKDDFFDGSGRAPTKFDIFLLICYRSSDNVIAGNRFDFSGGKSLIHLSGGCGAGSPGRQVIRNNVLSRFGNNPYGICAAINFGGAAASKAGNGSEVANNTIVDNGRVCFGILNTNASDIVVRNNILSHVTGRHYAIGCTGIADANTESSHSVARISLFFANDQDVDPSCAQKGWVIEGQLSADPMFVDPGASPPDLHLRCTRGDFGAYGTASASGRSCDAGPPIDPTQH